MAPSKRIERVYDYLDELGNLLYQVVRYIPKDFRPRRKHKEGVWKWDLTGVRRVPYGADRLARLKGKIIFICEGEKDTETAWSKGLYATCVAGGSNGWRDEYKEFFRDNYAVCLPHHDEPGLKYANKVMASVSGVALGWAILHLPGLVEHGDLTNYIDAGGTADAIYEMVPNVMVDRRPFLGNPDADDPPAPVNGKHVETNGKHPLWTIERERFADIKPEELYWLWENVWLDRAVNLLTGAPGLGKTFVAAHLTACVSRGLIWPDGSGKAPLGDVIFMSAEDSYASVLVHRVAAAGGDLSRVHRWTKKVSYKEDGTKVPSEITLEDIDLVATDIVQLPDLKLVIFDPVTSYLGSADANDNAEVRRVLNRLVELAEAKGFAVLLITHDKKMNVAAINSAMGSTAFTALPRVVQGLYRDPEDDTKRRRILSPIKNNHGDDRFGRTFVIDAPNGVAKQSRIIWDEEPDTRSADEVRAQIAKTLANFGRERGEDDSAKRRHVKILEIVDAVGNANEGFVSLQDIREKCTLSGTAISASIFELCQMDILEERTIDKVLPNGALKPSGQRVVRRIRHSFAQN